MPRGGVIQIAAGWPQPGAVQVALRHCDRGKQRPGDRAAARADDGLLAVGRVIAELSAGHRCVAPTLPFGAHRHAMRADADLSLPGIARLVAELLDRLDLRDVTLVGNDTGGALVQLLIGDGAARVGRVVHGRRLADLFPDGWLVEIDDSYTLIPLDQPARLAQAIGELAPAAVQRPR